MIFGVIQCVCCMTIGVVAYVRAVWREWCREFYAVRVDRSHQGSPSHHLRPEVTSERRFAELSKAARQAETDSIEELARRQSQSVVEAPTLLRRSFPSGILNGVMKVNTERRSSKLHFDHVHLTFSQFLWGFCFIAPGAFLGVMFGVMVLHARHVLHRLGLITLGPHNPRQLVAEMLLETMESIQYVGMKDGGPGCLARSRVAVFAFPDFPMLAASGDFTTAKLFTVAIDLGARSMVSATLDGRELIPKEALILVWFHMMSAGHVRTHALANWGTNTFATDAEVRRNSVATVMYNYFGQNAFAALSSLTFRLGLLRHPCGDFVKVLEKGANSGIPFHANIRELQPHSETINFVIKCRQRFMREFERHNKDFGGIDGEALFAGSVLHSLDHSNAARILHDPLWLDVDSSDFGLMAELGRFGRVGFFEDIPLLYMSRRMRDMKHPFYKAVYRYAARINKTLADNMDGCIIK